MAAWESLFGKESDERIWKMVAFLGRLDSLPESVNAEWRRKPVP